jgi:hypothetical protein
MPKRVLAIGVGGSGKAILTLFKERLEETYGQIPDQVVLLSFDTDSLRDIDQFAGTRLNAFSQDGREPEFQQVISPPGMTMDTIFSDIRGGRTTAYMHWLEQDKLDLRLGPSERDIRGGAQQRRPVGRTALFLRWDRPIYSAIINAIARMYGEVDQVVPEAQATVDEELAAQTERGKRLIFIVGSVAGGTGSGFFLDIANLVRHAVDSNDNWQSVDVSAVIVLPDAFQAYTTAMNDPTNLKPNSYAALRELDRFVRTHSSALPYMIRYDENTPSITWSTNQPLDHLYLVDTASRDATGDFDLSGDPMRGVFPVISDFIMAHVDNSLGDALATLRSNAGLHYSKSEGWQYSSFNVKNFIFPIDDIIESFSYRFLIETVERYFLPPGDMTGKARITQNARQECEELFTQTTVNDKTNPLIIRKMQSVTRKVEPERLEMSWRGLLNLLTISDTSFRTDYERFNNQLTELAGRLEISRVGDYRQESYEEGYIRLINLREEYMNQFLGQEIEAGNEGSRFGGAWDAILENYRQSLFTRFAEALDSALLGVLNERDGQTRRLLEQRLPMAREMTAVLKTQLVQFRRVIEQSYRQLDLERQISKIGEEVRAAITWMNDTKQRKSFALFGKPEAHQAQERFVQLFQQQMEMLLQQRLYQAVLEVLDALGAAELYTENNQRRRSVIDEAALQLENWQTEFESIVNILRDDLRMHNAHREQKRQIKVRRYMTNAEIENQLYQSDLVDAQVRERVLGQIQGETGIQWQRKDPDLALDYRPTMSWTAETEGARNIATAFFEGTKTLFQGVRTIATASEQITSPAHFTSSSSFVNLVTQVNEPFLRYNPSNNNKRMFPEYYVSFSTSGVSDKARKFLEDAGRTLRQNGINVDTQAESAVACTVVEISRGVKLSAIDQFEGCEPDYRTKLSKVHETLHIFPEEQIATTYERNIQALGEADNQRRLLDPAVVIAMGDERKLRTFILAYAYGLIEIGRYTDPETYEDSIEVLLRLKPTTATNPAQADTQEDQGIPLSQSEMVRRIDAGFAVVADEERSARLYLNALQNFVLKVTKRPGLDGDEISTVVQTLQRRGIDMGHIQNPFTLDVNEVTRAIREYTRALGPTEEEEPNRTARDAQNARRQIERHLQPFINKEIAQFKLSPAQRIRDMGTVMHLIINEEIRKLSELARNS